MKNMLYSPIHHVWEKLLKSYKKYKYYRHFVLSFRYVENYYAHIYADEWFNIRGRRCFRCHVITFYLCDSIKKEKISCTERTDRDVMQDIVMILFLLYKKKKKLRWHLTCWFFVAYNKIAGFPWSNSQRYKNCSNNKIWIQEKNLEKNNKINCDNDIQCTDTSDIRYSIKYIVKWSRERKLFSLSCDDQSFFKCERGYELHKETDRKTRIWYQTPFHIPYTKFNV